MNTIHLNHYIFDYQNTHILYHLKVFPHFFFYTFHIPIMKEQIPKDAKILEDILEEKIPSEKQKTKLTYNQAVQVLKDFLK